VLTLHLKLSGWERKLFETIPDHVVYLPAGTPQAALTARVSTTSGSGAQRQGAGPRRLCSSRLQQQCEDESLAGVVEAK